MKLVLLGATFLVGASVFSRANAADVYSPGGSLKDGPTDYRPAIGWGGIYAGVNVGGVFGDEAELTTNIAGISGSEEIDDTAIAGVQIGYNWQRNNVVVGVEGDWSFLGDRESEFGLEFEDNWLATIRGRLGVAAGPALIYATGGVAFLDTELTASGDDDTLVGWVAGAGIDYKLRENVSLGLEGLYHSFEDDASLGALDADLERNFFTVRARLNYHFGSR